MGIIPTNPNERINIVQLLKSIVNNGADSISSKIIKEQFPYPQHLINHFS